MGLFEITKATIIKIDNYHHYFHSQAPFNSIMGSFSSISFNSSIFLTSYALPVSNSQINIVLKSCHGKDTIIVLFSIRFAKKLIYLVIAYN